jgi:hypothetical protein
MIGLSEDLDLAIKNAIDVLNAPIDITDVDSDKLSNLMKSVQDGFLYTKELIVSWENSQNAPSHSRLKGHIEKLVEAGENSMDILRKALRKSIDVAEVDPDKYGTAIKAKPIIFSAINAINAGVIELKLQIDSDKFDLKQREFKRSYPEKFANQEFYPLKNYHKEWYDEETKSIMICPKGTKGEVITIDNLNIMLPKKPKNTDIRYHRMPKEQQYWRREEMPKGLTPENENVYADYIMEQFRIRREGLWFMNNGEAVYITGTQWMGLQWNKMLDTGGYKDFRMAQRDMYLFGRACALDPRCVGELFVKGRRTGFTEEKIDYLVDESTSTKNALYGITSKTGDDAQEAYLKYSYVVQNLPFFFIPVVKGKIDDRNKMEFGKVSDSSKVAKLKRQTGTEDYLNTKVDWMTTTTLAYDSKKLKGYLCDEAGKREKPNNIIDHYNNVKPTMVTGGRVVGKCWMGSTLNPLDKGGAEFQKLYYGSDVTKRNENDRTSTGMYSFFLPAHKNMEDYTDKYGICHITLAPGESFYNAQGELKTKGSLQFLEAEFKSAKAMGGKVHNNTRRLDPITIEDAFRDELQSQLYDVEKINDQIYYNRQVEIENTLIQGNFTWENGVKFSKVLWVPNPRGRFLLSWIPNVADRNKSTMRMVFGRNTNCPVSNFNGSLACDPYDKDAVVDSKLIETEQGVEFNLGSRGAIHGLTGFNINEAPSNYFFLEYICRPKDAETFFEDALMACIFYSLPILVENNKGMMLEYFYRNGYRGYCTTRFDKEINRLSPDEKKFGGIPNSSADMINRHWTATESYINKYVGKYKYTEGEHRLREDDEMGSMPFSRTLNDWLRFDIKDRTKFDASISSGLAIMAINQSLYAPKIENKPFVLNLHRYNNN